MREIKTLPNYEVEFIPLERCLNERRTDSTETMVECGLNSLNIRDRRGVPDRRPLAEHEDASYR